MFEVTELPSTETQEIDIRQCLVSPIYSHILRIVSFNFRKTILVLYRQDVDGVTVVVTKRKRDWCK